MNLDYLNEIVKMSKEQLERELESIIMSENERKLFEKSKALIDQGYKMTRLDSGEKVFKASILYYAITRLNNNK